MYNNMCYRLTFDHLIHCIFWFYSFISVLTKKPNNIRQQEIWRLECDLGVVADFDCPVHGGWSLWVPWSHCHGSCDSIGHRSRTRECVNPPPSIDGIPCSGPAEQTESCFITNCTVEDYRNLVSGDLGRIQAIRQLETVPALMERCLTSECPFEAIVAALATDNTWQLNSESLWNSLQCVKYNLGCPILGRWGAWGSWSACGARCGSGLRWRLRRCDTPSPSEAKFICTGSPLDIVECTGDQCAHDRKSSSGSWGEWERWTICSEQCGVGIRRRRRSCLETHTLPAFGVWGTHCKGQHDQLEECESKRCTLNGGWSGWSSWGPCSQTCGAGRQARSRSCTRPIPTENGISCVGSKIEIGSCYCVPCQVKSHNVALFNGDSSLQYHFKNRRSTLFHFYIRFMALSPNGILVRRSSIYGSSVRLSVINWHVCLDANGSSQACSPPRICSQSIIEPSVWHTSLITVSNEAITLRLDDAPITIRSSFSCEPELPNDSINVFIGEKLHGAIQELILNFIPLKLSMQRQRVKKYDFSPCAALNVGYDKAILEEAYLDLQHEQYLRLPCFEQQGEWHLELTLKPTKPSGTIIFLQDNDANWLLLSIENMRLKLKIKIRDLHSESATSVEYLPDRWLDISISKQLTGNAIEVVINNNERLLLSFEPVSTNKKDQYSESRKYAIKNIESVTQSKILKRNIDMPKNISLCADEYYIGGVPMDVKRNLSEELLPFFGTIATFRINGLMQDLYAFNKELGKDDTIQVSSRTASISSSYHEISWGRLNHLNLTCLHAKNRHSINKALWLFLDTTVNEDLLENTLRAVDDGKVLKLYATANNKLRGFYTCRAYTNRETRNVVTYGVLGKIKNNLSGPDMTTAIAVFTTLALVIGTLSWLFYEGIHDLRDGHGFYRDAHLSPLEEAEAVCRYIDNNMHLIGNKRSGDMAKAKARKRGRILESRASFAAQEPQGLLKENLLTNQESIDSEPEDLPALPETDKSCKETIHNIFRCAPNYISSPRHGSIITSPRTRMSSSSSFELTSPRVLSSRLLLNKHLHSNRSSTKVINHCLTSRKALSPLLTIKSSSYVNQTPARKILQKFYKLKKNDD